MASILKKKKKKKLTQAKLLKKFEPEMKAIILARDGNKCQIKGFPEHKCGGSLVADHRPAKRGKHSTFFDPRNLTCVCSTANFMADKGFNSFVHNAIIQVIKRREGDSIIEELHAKSRLTKKWDELQIRKWIDDCKRWFLKNKNGAPKD